MRDQGRFEPVGIDRGNREAHPIDRDRPVQDRHGSDVRGESDVDQDVFTGPVERADFPRSVHMPLYQMPAEPLSERESLLQVHGAAVREFAERGARESGTDRLDGE